MSVSIVDIISDEDVIALLMMDIRLASKQGAFIVEQASNSFCLEAPPRRKESELSGRLRKCRPSIMKKPDVTLVRLKLSWMNAHKGKVHRRKLCVRPTVKLSAEFRELFLVSHIETVGPVGSRGTVLGYRE